MKAKNIRQSKLGAKTRIDRARAAWLEHYQRFNLKAEWLDQTFKWKRGTWKITGLNLRMPKNVVELTRISWKIRKTVGCPAHLLRLIFEEFLPEKRSKRDRPQSTPEVAAPVSPLPDLRQAKPSAELASQDQESAA